ncbi:DgyrCDS5141 [Dimorphilus gyrociliatus]|uniref:DgyrCDS5141 n=1 Tax=Dimorphilus gyrociliatus TaxID=2664684 RepID=A0A7I8VLB3_9ANNE|nr:DgyrCDS5141 [Dimorphilus gyrociliatus]
MNGKDNFNQRCQEFTILYTHQKLKKSKTWKDGFLKTTINSTKVAILSESRDLIDSFHYRFDKIYSGAEIESDQLLIQIQDTLDKNDSFNEERKAVNNAHNDHPTKIEPRTNFSQPFKKIKLSNETQKSEKLTESIKIYQPNSSDGHQRVRTIREILHIIGIDQENNPNSESSNILKVGKGKSSSKSNLELEIDLDCFSESDN